MKVIDAINMEHYTKQPYGKIIVSNNQLVIIFWNNFTDVITLVIFYISIYKIENSSLLEILIDDNIGITVHEQCADSKFLLQITFLEDRYILSNNKFRQHKEYSTNWVNQHRFDYIIIRDKINCSRKSFITSNDKLKNSLPENLLIDKVEVHI